MIDDGLRGKELEQAYWYNTHRRELVTAAYGLAWGVVGIIWLVLLYQLFIYVTHISATQRAINTVGDTTVIYDSVRAPSSLQIKTTLALEDGLNQVDIYGLIHNPNLYYVGRFTYTVSLDGNLYEFNDGIVLPNTDTHLGIFGGTGSRLSSASIAINEVQWQRIRGPEPRHDFQINDIVVDTTDLADGTTEPTETNTNGNDNVNGVNINSNTTQFATPTSASSTTTAARGETVSQVTATAFNDSPYGFKRAVATVVLKSPLGDIVGVQQTTLTNVKPFSDTPLRFIWNRRFEFNSTAEIFVETDAWDEANLIAPGQ